MKSKVAGKQVPVAEKVVLVPKSKGVVGSRVNFSTVEDSPQAIRILRQLGAQAARKAVADAKAAGLTTAYIRNKNKLVVVDSDGKATPLKPIYKRAKYYTKVKEGTTVYAIKK